VLQVATSVRAFPNYMPYSNELWGGPNETYKYLTDSNSDWAQQLKSLNGYLKARGAKDCWFAYFGEGTCDVAYYGVACKPLPTQDGFWLGEIAEVPPAIAGPVVISAGVLSGFEFGPGALNPYAQFQSATPTAQIDGALFVYDGRFEIPLASALALAQASGRLLGAGQPEAALEKARQAVALAPNDLRTQIALGDALTALRRPEEARPAYEKALLVARTVETDFQGWWIPILEDKLRRL